MQKEELQPPSEDSTTNHKKKEVDGLLKAATQYTDVTGHLNIMNIGVI